MYIVGGCIKKGQMLNINHNIWIIVYGVCITINYVGHYSGQLEASAVLSYTSLLVHI